MKTEATSGCPELGPRYMSANKLLETIFEPDCRPSLRSLRKWQSQGILPHVRLGKLVFFDPVAVRLALERKRTLRARA